MNYANVKDLKLSDSEIYWILLYFYFGLRRDRDNAPFWKRMSMLFLYYYIMCVPFVTKSSSFFESHSLYSEHREQSMSQEVTYKSLKMVENYRTITTKSDRGRLPEVVLYERFQLY